MTPLSGNLADDARKRWQTIQQSLPDVDITAKLTQDQIRDVGSALVFSDFAYRQIVHRPHLWKDLLEQGDLLKPYARAAFEDGLHAWFEHHLGIALPRKPDLDGSGPPVFEDNKAGVMKLLRNFRQREMTRIAIRDICRWADLEETLADLSTLACACLQTALTYAYGVECGRWGAPVDGTGRICRMVVIGMGKLGAGELNFSSDVDLMFAYARRGKTQGGSRGQITNEEFFSKVARELIQLIGQTTADGFVFRVDTRLRPFGDSGPLVMHFDSLEAYYESQGREWERYALIKAAVVAGDRQSGDDLLERLKPFIFRRYLDFGAFDSLREMKRRIDMEIKGKGLETNIKLGPGGIREIEFFGQMFQLIRGGVEPELQVRPIRRVLKVLAEHHYIKPALQQLLDDSYVRLRTVENRIQQWADQQEHRLPSEPDQQSRLALSLGYEGWPEFISALNHVRSQVHDHFSQLLTPASEGDEPDAQAESIKLLESIWQGLMDTDRAQQVLLDLGYEDPQQALQQVTALREDRSVTSQGQVGSDRLNRLIPLVIKAVGSAPRTNLVLDRIFELIRSIHKRTAYLAMMLENPSILHHLVTLTDASPWIAVQLCRHPVLLDELVDPRTLYRPPKRREMENEVRQRLGSLAADDLENQMEALRIFKQVNLLRVAASDITHVLPLMKVSDHLSDIAEIAVDAAVNLCWRQLTTKNGTPSCSLDKNPCELGFAVIAYGKLGGLELGYGSDLDLVFLHAAQSGWTVGSERVIDNTTFFARLGQRVLHMLTTHTAAGVLYEVDMRLRPSGDSGMLVSHIKGFADYQEKEAWTWEHQALLRARPIFGDQRLKDRFQAIRREILTRPRDEDRLKADVIDMRQRLRREQGKPTNGQFNIKHGEGGILDIEFLVQYLALQYAHQHPEIIQWTDNVRQLQTLNEVGVLDHATAFGLRKAYLIYRDPSR